MAALINSLSPHHAQPSEAEGEVDEGNSNQLSHGAEHSICEPIGQVEHVLDAGALELRMKLSL